MKYPKCGSEPIVKNGSIHNKKQKFKCIDRCRRFAEAPSVPRMDDKRSSLYVVATPTAWQPIAPVRGASCDS